jgi:hypothetical protein
MKCERRRIVPKEGGGIKLHAHLYIYIIRIVQIGVKFCTQKISCSTWTSKPLKEETKKNIFLQSYHSKYKNFLCDK